MSNAEFLHALEASFSEFIRSGTSRSTAKLVPLHGAIARDMHECFGDGYTIQSQGYAFGNSVIHNDYESFAAKVYHTVLAQ